MTQTHIHTDADLDVGLAALRRADPRFAALMATAGRPPLRRRPDGFAGLAAIIVAQQLSTASAGAIWGRLADAFDPFEPAVIRRARATRPAPSCAVSSRWQRWPTFPPTRRTPR
jgi:DNA-3-methyladenine glycosylase II